MWLNHVFEIGFLMGLIGSLHCIGMCGPLVMALPISGQSNFQKWVSILLYHLGKISSYTVLGILLGLFGTALPFNVVQEHLSIVLGSIMLLYVLYVFVIKSKWAIPFFQSNIVYSLIIKKMGALFKSKKSSSFYLIGFLNGLLPCGMVYVALTSAIATQSLVQGGMIMAIKMGKNVFVEKPMANTIEEGKTIVNMVKEANVKLQVGHVERFNPAFTALKDLTLNPLFIEVHRLAQFNPRGTEVSVILDLMIHDIDIILSIVKSDVKSISASGVAVLTDTPDIANVRIEFNNGCVANLTSSRISMKKMRKIRLFQKDAYIGIDFLEKNTEIIKLQQPDEAAAFSFDIETHQGTKTISINTPVIEQGNAIKAELSSFVHAILNDETPVVNEMDGYLAMEVAHQILEKIGKSTSNISENWSTDLAPREDLESE